MRFKIDWASLIVGRKFAVFALIYIVFEGNFQLQVPGGGGLYLEGQFNGGFLRYEFGGLIFGGAYFRNFTVFHIHLSQKKICLHQDPGAELGEEQF